MTWDAFPNLRRRPSTPSKGRGPVQVRIKRAFIARGAEVLSSSEIYSWSHIRRRLGRCKSMPAGVYWRTLRTLKTMCDPVGRGPGRGRPILWRLRNSAGAQTSPVLPGEAKKRNSWAISMLVQNCTAVYVSAAPPVRGRRQVKRRGPKSSGA
jgi:hypothetical protein